MQTGCDILSVLLGPAGAPAVRAAREEIDCIFVWIKTSPAEIWANILGGFDTRELYSKWFILKYLTIMAKDLMTSYLFREVRSKV